MKTTFRVHLVLCVATAASTAVAASKSVSVAISPDRDWVFQQAGKSRCAAPTRVPFSMKAIGGKANFVAHASVCGEIDRQELESIFRQIGFANAVSRVGSSWRVSVVGDRQVAVVELMPVDYNCAGWAGSSWGLWQSAEGWKVASPVLRNPEMCVRTPSPVDSR